MAAALEDNRDEPMDERLLRALEAGKAAGGQGPPASGPVPEAWAMIQVFNDQQPWPAVDVRIDLDIDPVPKLRRLVTQLKRLDGLYRTMGPSIQRERLTTTTSSSTSTTRRSEPQQVGQAPGYGAAPVV